MNSQTVNVTYEAYSVKSLLDGFACLATEIHKRAPDEDLQAKMKPDDMAVLLERFWCKAALDGAIKTDTAGNLNIDIFRNFVLDYFEKLDDT